MIATSARLKALLAGGAVLSALGLTAPAMAGGANDGCPGGIYCGPATQPDRDNGAPSRNGNGDRNATGRPAAGSVGNADHKNPPGQLSNPDEDGNNGYECDGNQGVGQGNPAHTGCDSYSNPDPDPDPGEYVDN